MNMITSTSCIHNVHEPQHNSLNMLLAMVLLQCSCPQCSLARAYNIHTQASHGRVTDSQSIAPPPQDNTKPIISNLPL